MTRMGDCLAMSRRETNEGETDLRDLRRMRKSGQGAIAWSGAMVSGGPRIYDVFRPCTIASETGRTVMS